MSELAGDLSGEDDSESEAVTDSDDDDGVTGRLSDATADAAYRTNPNLPDFIHPHGPLIHASGSSAYEIFCWLFSDELLALMLKETNMYYDQTVAALGGLDKLPPVSCLRDWMPVDLPCMKAFLAILILMGVDQRNSYELYWTTIEYIALANFKNLMPKNCFMIILRCLHVCDNTKIDGMDKLAKIRSMLNILVAAWQAAYYPNREICLDESMIAFKGRTSAMFYQLKKPHKWGMQAWFLADLRTAYCYNLDIYSGKRADNVDSGVDVTHATVMCMVHA